MGEQTSFTDDLYDVDIKIAILHKELRKIETRIHFLRSTIAIVKMKNNSPARMKKLNWMSRELTSALDWISDLMFYLNDASCDVETKSLTAYKKLRDMENPVEMRTYIDKEQLSSEMLNIRVDLFRLFDVYDKYIDSVKPCMTIYENLIDVVREAAKKMKEL